MIVNAGNNDLLLFGVFTFPYILKKNLVILPAIGVISLDIVDRIFLLVDKQYDEQRDFATALGVSPTMVSAWRMRKSQSYMKRIPQIAKILGVTVDQLLDEDIGEIACGPSQPYLVRRYNELSRKHQKEVMDFIEFKWEQQQKGL